VSSSTTHIVRLHDILPITHPEFFSTKARIAFNRGLAGLLSNKNIVWVMDTEASKKEFMSFFGNKLKIAVIPCEVGYGLNPPTVPVAKENRKNNTFLTVNTIEPRKNVRLIVKSFLTSLKLDSAVSDDELIIAGSYGWLEDDLILKLRSGHYGPQVKFIEKPDEAQIKRLYESSDFVISASEAEGFGLPPLEGILFGCLPLVSKLPQHFETMGTEAIYFDLNEESLSQAIFSARSLSISKRRELALTLHKQVRSRFSHEVLKIRWESLLTSIQAKSFGIGKK
jgi:alpha-1,2-rhamnosyltransferase